MRMRLFDLLKKSIKPGLAATAILASSAGLYAQNGTWTSTVDGLWSSGGNWAGGVVANGANNTANFNTLNISDQTGATGFPAVGVELDSPRTIGHLIFGDTNTASPGAWDLFTLTQATNILTLSDATKPTITVNPLGPVGLSPAQDSARVLVDLAGTQGFTKLGAGILQIQGATNAITGGININEGTLRVSTALPAQTFTIANGATLNPTVAMDAVGTRIFSVASGATANLSITNSVEVGRFDASGANINVNFPATNYPGGPAIAAGARFTPSGNWLAATGSTSPATFVVNSQNGTPTPTTTPVTTQIPQTGAVVRLAPNLSNTTIRNFNGNTFATTAVTLNNTLLYSRTNSGGNTFNFGSLTGDSTAILSGGNAGAHATYSIGALNTDTTFAGTIDIGSATAAETTAADTGGLNLTKVGTGTLTLSGTLAYQPTGRGNVAQRGGITTVSAGTLKLTNNAAIPGGIVHGTVGNVISTINIVTGATLDVSGYSGSYSTANLQQVVGAGTIVGNWTHDEGVIRPANTINGTTASGTSPSVAVAGTINFVNNFTWNGGEVTFDIAPTPATGNDLLSVGGAATLSSGLVTPNFTGGIPTTGTYTLLTAGSISGSAAGITVAWPGRAADPIPFIDGNSLKVSAPGLSSANLTWVGNNGANWDVETTASWTGASPNTFFQSDNVTFNDTASSFNVNLVGNLQPTAVTVNNTANAYTFSGTGAIGGAATFTKTGSGLLTMTTANLFSGAAFITGGTVNIENASGALGTGPLTLSNAQLNSNVNATSGLTNSSLMVPAGTSSTIRSNKSVPGNAPWGIPALAGDGTLTLTSESFGHIIDFSANANSFTGVLNLVGATDTEEPIDTVNTTVFRLNSASSSLPNAEVNLTNGASLRDRATSAQTLTLGSLSGDATSTLYGYQGGSGATARTWVIGGLNMNTTFAGVIQDSSGQNSTTAPVTLNKVGTGELELTGVNIYTGATNVQAGILSITNPYLANDADVSVSTGALLELNFVGTDTISDLVLGGLPRAIGEWGGPLSGAPNISNLLGGTGRLNVTAFTPLPFTPGDFDQDGDVDGRDFLIWQRGGSPGGVGNATDLANWQTNYGSTTPLTANNTAVPEPTGIVLVVMAGLLVAARRRS